MVHCEACGVSDPSRSIGITFHRFPKNAEQRCVWIKFVTKLGKFVSNAESKWMTLCSQHFDSSCFDKSSTSKVRLRPNSVPTINVVRSKYSRISVSTTVGDGITTNISSDVILRGESEKFDVSTIQMDKNENPKSLLKNKAITQLPFANGDSSFCDIDDPLQTVNKDTQKKCSSKRKIMSLGRLLAEKSNQIRKLQKQTWKQQKRIVQLESIVKKLNRKNFIMEDHDRSLDVELHDREDVKNIDHDHAYFSECKNLSKDYEEVVIYIASLVSRKLSETLVCEFCVGALHAHSENTTHSSMKMKNGQNQTYPSNDVINICLTCEKVFRGETNSQRNLKETQTNNLVHDVLAEFSNTVIFDNLQCYEFNNDSLENHTYILTEAIAGTYFDLRINYECDDLIMNEKE